MPSLSRNFVQKQISAISGFVVFAALLIALWSNFSGLSVLQDVDRLRGQSLAATDVADGLLKAGSVEHPEIWIETARQLSSKSPEHDLVAISLLEQALQVKSEDYEAWALLAFLHRRHAGVFNESVEAALKQSFLACPYCNRDILQWRFTFVLANWQETSEETRLAAFSGADFLRWWHLEYDYLEAVRQDAVARGIPFREYRQKIDTPARPNEIGLPSD